MNKPDLRMSILQLADRERVPAILEAASVSHNALVRTPDWFDWKFWSSPFGPAVVAYAETMDRRIAGAVAFGQYGLTCGEANIKAALTYEAFVHPDFRRHGLFTQLVHLGMSECNARDVQLMFSFPNAASLPGYLKQGWVPVDCIRSFVRPINWENCVTRFDRRIRCASFVPDPLSEFDPRDYEGFDDCLSTMISIRSDGAWAAIRTPEYMIWRYRVYPMYHYVVIRDDDGWTILRTGRRGKYAEVQIMELFPFTGYSVRFLRALRKRIARRLQPDIITITLSSAHPIFKSLWAAVFLPAPNRANFTYYPLCDQLRSEKRAWVLSATDVHTL